MIRALFSFIFLLAFLTSCSKEKVPAEFELQQTSFEQISTISDDDMLGTYNAFLRSCEKIARKQGEYLSDHSAVQINRDDYLKVCSLAREVMPSKFKEFILDNFTPYLVTYHGEEQGKFTAYYEAQLNGSPVRDNTYKYPIYGRPYDLVEVNLHDFDPSLPARKLVGMVEDGRLKPYLTRAEITQKGVNAPVVMWADDEVDVYIMQIQGSAVAIQPDGSKVRIAYAGNNGHPFKGIGSILLGKGLLNPSQASMGNIKKWLKENPGLAKANMDENQRFIFHKLGNSEGPTGAQGVPLTAGRSLAVDTDYIPLGALLWLETTRYDGSPLNRLVVAQDIGGAIKGAIRGDYFYGSGGDDILEAAGKMNSQGRYFVLIPKHYEDNSDE